MQKIDFSQAGGFPLKQEVFARMQSAYFDILRATLGFYGLNNTGNFIIDGFQISGTTITEGVLYMSGDLVFFSGATGNTTSRIAKVSYNETAAFKNGTNPTVFFNTIAEINPSGVLYTDFVQLPKITELNWNNITGKPNNLVSDANYVHTDNNFTNGLQNKLNLLPNSFLVRTVYGVITLGDIPNPTNTTQLVTGNIISCQSVESTNANDCRYAVMIPQQQNLNYSLFVNFISEGNWNADNDCLVMTRNKQLNSFEFVVSEFYNISQNLKLEVSILNNINII